MLHLIFQSTLEQSLLSRIESGDDVIFLGDPVLQLLQQGRWNETLLGMQQHSINLYVLRADLETRGIRDEELIQGIKPIDYSTMVGLTEKNKVSRTWN